MDTVTVCSFVPIVLKNKGKFLLVGARNVVSLFFQFPVMETATTYYLNSLAPLPRAAFPYDC